MKKLISLVLALIMIFSLAITVSAEEETGTIKVKNVAVFLPDGEDTYETVASYKVYQMLRIATYDEQQNLYTYVVTDPLWETFLTTDDVAKQYFTVAENDYVTWNKSASGEPTTVAATIAPRALQYAIDNNIQVTSDEYTMGQVQTDETTGATTADITFKDLELGYYLVDSSMGVLCGLTTAAPNAEVVAKNVPPTLDKKVQEDAFVNSTTNAWGDNNTADIGQLVNYDITIDVRSGAQNYVLHDKLSEGLTIIGDGVIKHISSGSYQETVLNKGADYIIHSISSEGVCVCGEESCNGPEDECTFEIVFTASCCARLKTNDKIVVLYSAVLNDKAVTGSVGNPNTAWVSFGEDHETEEEIVNTYTYFFDLVKTDGDRNLLDGAVFQLYHVQTGGSPIALKHINAADKGKEGYIPTYRLVYDANGAPAAATEQTSDIVVEGGHVRIEGIDKGTYYLEETKEPTGYNKLEGRHEFSITNTNLAATFDTDGKVSSTSPAVKVQNSAGAVLPQTGGMGTLLFVTFGMFTVLATGVLLVTKKRMSMIEE